MVTVTCSALPSITSLYVYLGKDLRLSNFPDPEIGYDNAVVSPPYLLGERHGSRYKYQFHLHIINFEISIPIFIKSNISYSTTVHSISLIYQIGYTSVDIYIPKYESTPAHTQINRGLAKIAKKIKRI